ncbi:MAG: aminoacyl-tRNA hydrolase [Candidatus Margulisbacteria bacterium]|nr:aminoacyl-tRNA hydrolase [Candidatus Margulisiibacteriota bacterium]
MANDQNIYAVIGLGNPGPEYEHTRHNAGFMAIDALTKAWNTGKFKQEKKLCSYVLTQQKGARIYLVKPTTFMNNSGTAAIWIKSFFKIPEAHIIIIYDDIALPCGQIRIRKKGSSGGHNGVESIISQISDNFGRIRIGIKSADPIYSLHNFVLNNFTPEESTVIYHSLKQMPDIIKTIVAEGFEKAMNLFNAKVPKINGQNSE